MRITIKIILLGLLLPLTLFASQYQVDSRDALVNIRTASAKNCIYFGFDHAFNEQKNLSFSLAQQSCDEFTSENERVFEMSKRLGIGLLYFSTTAYEDAWFIGFNTGPKNKETQTYKGSSSTVYLWENDIMGGHQWHFESGFIATIGYLVSAQLSLFNETNLAYDEEPKTITEIHSLNEGREFESNVIFSLGWRF